MCRTESIRGYFRDCRPQADLARSSLYREPSLLLKTINYAVGCTSCETEGGCNLCDAARLHTGDMCNDRQTSIQCTGTGLLSAPSFGGNCRGRAHRSSNPFVIENMSPIY